MVCMFICRVGRTIVKGNTQKTTQLQILKSVGAEVGSSLALEALSGPAVATVHQAGERAEPVTSEDSFEAPSYSS